MIEGIFVDGLIFSIMVLGVLITYRILDFPDLTTDGSFATGAAVATISIVNGLGLFPAILLATLAGAAAGIVTATIHNHLKVPGTSCRNSHHDDAVLYQHQDTRWKGECPSSQDRDAVLQNA